MNIFMTNSNYKEEEAYIYVESNTLYVETSRSKWVPTYLYYMIEHWNTQSPVQIENVCFTVDGAFEYKVEELKGKQEWIEVGGE